MGGRPCGSHVSFRKRSCFLQGLNQELLLTLSSVPPKGLFRQTLTKPLSPSVHCRDDEEEEKSLSAALLSPSASGQKKANPFLTLSHDPEAKTYRQGLLARKVHAEADGKKSECWARGHGEQQPTGTWACERYQPSHMHARPVGKLGVSGQWLGHSCATGVLSNLQPFGDTSPSWAALEHQRAGGGPNLTAPHLTLLQRPGAREAGRCFIRC